MQTLTERVFLLAPPGGFFDESVVRNLYPDATEGARRQLVHRAVQHGEVLRLKPGLYCLAEPWARSRLHPFALASLLHSPSHISCESALAHHGLIPEAVCQVVSVTARRGRVFRTPLGEFHYVRVPTTQPRAGVHAVRLDEASWAFIASPLRAIADLISLRREVSWQRDGLGFLTSSMRLELDELQPLASTGFEEVRTAFRSGRVRRYLEGMMTELRP